MILDKYFKEVLAVARVYNFSAGPAVLPEEVLQEAADEMLDYRGTGMSVMEMSHRSKAYDEIIKTAEADLRDLMNIPDNYKVLFLQGGASQQFAMIPMNLMKNGVADYIVTGQWAKKAYTEACKYGKANKIASSEDKTFSYIPDCSDLPIQNTSKYKRKDIGSRRFFLLLVRTCGCDKIWCHLWRCSEKYRTCRRCYRDHPRRFDS